MKLLVIRHAIAMDREEYAQGGQPDDFRPLTRKGARKMKRIAKALRKEIATIDRLASSPYTRAVETARIVADAFGIDDVGESVSLMPDAPLDEFEEWCAAGDDHDVIAVVGHEPHLSSLITWLLTGHEQSRVLLKKGGACLLEFEAPPLRSTGTMIWLLTPRQLVDLAE